MFFKKKKTATIDFEGQAKNTQKAIDYQNRLLSSLAQDGSLDDQIKSYENAFLLSDPPLASTTHELKLAELYIKAEMYDKAWRYLNKLYNQYIGTAEPIWKVRDLQAKVLKHEKKYDQAIEMYLLKYVEKGRDFETQEKMIIKDLKPCATKLSWDESRMIQLMSLIEKYLKSRNPTDISIEYRKLLKEWQ